MNDEDLMRSEQGRTGAMDCADQGGFSGGDKNVSLQNVSLQIDGPWKTVMIAVAAQRDMNISGDCSGRCDHLGFRQGKPRCRLFDVSLEEIGARILRCGECITMQIR